jgi:quercetin dioxygenase-like cupin family protein
MRKSIVAVCLAVSAVAAVSAVSVAAPAPGPNVERNMLLQQDLSIPNYSTALVEVTIPAGGREGKHTHPGSAVVYVQQGALTLSMEGVAEKTYQVGESFFIPTGKIHEGINNGSGTVKAIASFVVEKGKPLASPAQ